MCCKERTLLIHRRSRSLFVFLRVCFVRALRISLCVCVCVWPPGAISILFPTQGAFGVVSTMRKAAGLARKGVRRKQQQEKQQQQQQQEKQQQQQQQQHQGKNQYQREDSGKILSNDGSAATGQRRQPTEEEAALTAKNYRMAKELVRARKMYHVAFA